ncbi:MAG: heat-inducible transcriptional repressor HrcA [Eubacteriales bacterium]|nr:heat-inducible transcriptional repressor HrcA [Eubacteriales bacterium]MDD4389942.1 heat-inducible transcriptional repressor HrcA [Eubacteriales bacterium]
MDLNERKLKILHTIIADFISTGEPVGSRTLSKKYELGISPATIRNEMSDLEEMGFLTHTHTSAGRMPSDKAYRLYVNNFMQKYELPNEEKKEISDKLTGNFVELDETIRHAASLLSEITNLTSFAITPKQDEDILSYIRLIPLDNNSVVLMIVAKSGRVMNNVLKLEVPYTEEKLNILSKALTYDYKGKTICEALEGDIIKNFNTDIIAMQFLAKDIMPNFVRTLERMLDVNLYMDGLTNIFALPEYNDIYKAKSFLEMLNNKDELTKILVNREHGVIITIGDENSADIVPDCSLITATYHVDGKLLGKIGVIGPTRMKYGEVTSVIEYMSENLNDMFKLIGGSKKDD